MLGRLYALYGTGLTVQRFSYLASAQQILFGAGCLSELPAIARQHKWRRVMLCTTPHLRQNGIKALVEDECGEAIAVSYDEVEPHVQGLQVDEALALAQQFDVEAIIGLGGGSPIGLAKAVSFELASRRTGRRKSGRPDAPSLIAGIAIPTTYAGSEMTPIYGVTQLQADGLPHKLTVRDPRITPKVVIYDPELTVKLSPEMTAATGINALAHCIEAVYSKTRNPLSTAAALRGIYHIKRALLRCHQDGKDMAARTEMQLGSHLAGASLATVSMGIHHGTGHVLGGTAGVPHGIANCIVLPHAIRYNADTVATELAMLAEAMGVSRDGRRDSEMALVLADEVEVLIGRLGMPRRLRDVGVKRSALPKLAENMLENRAVGNNPKAVTLLSALPYLEKMW